MSRVAPKTGELVRLTNRIGVTARRAGEIYDAQGGVCRRCRSPLNKPFEVDHRVALALGGTNDRSNLEAICAEPCHREKTARDLKAIAKAKRLAGETGNRPKRPILSPGFNKSLKQKMDGTVIRRGDQ